MAPITPPFTSMVCPMQRSDATLPPADITMVSLTGHLVTLKPWNRHEKKSLYWLARLTLAAKRKLGCCYTLVTSRTISGIQKVLQGTLGNSMPNSSG